MIYSTLEVGDPISATRRWRSEILLSGSILKNGVPGAYGRSQALDDKKRFGDVARLGSTSTQSQVIYSACTSQIVHFYWFKLSMIRFCDY